MSTIFPHLGLVNLKVLTSYIVTPS